MKKIIISGGGTGGHIFPAISIANALKNKISDLDILFVGAKNRMEMEKVPAAGYKIIGLPVAGFQRKLSLKNITFFFKLFSSVLQANKIIKNFKPAVVVGVGGYASGPIMRAANNRKIPTVIQEQNSYAGVTNRLLAKRASKICVAYENMEKYFPKDKIILTGNPVRQDIQDLKPSRDEAINYFSLENKKKVILVIGGSLGARTINQAVLAKLKMLSQEDVQVIWQTGKYYFEDANDAAKKINAKNVKVYPFISRMDLAYEIADIIISRAGAGTISELCLVGKPVILIPSPNVAEDHQTKNAMALVNKNAALHVADVEAVDGLIPKALELLKDEKRQLELSKNIKMMALKDSADKIADEIIKLMESQ